MRLSSKKAREGADLGTFLREAWHLIEARDFVSGWHLDAICDHLMAVSRGQVRNLVINIPPRFSKSTTVNVMWPAWTWAEHDAGLQWLFSSYGQDLIKRDSQRCRQVIESEWYQERYGHKVRLRYDQNEKLHFANTAGGYRATTTVRGSGTGKGGDILVVDDPIKIEEIHSHAVRKAVIEWWRTVFSRRVNEPKRSRKVIIMQRLHQEDLTAWVLNNADDDWVHLSLPNEYEPERRTVIVIDGDRVRNWKQHDDTWDPTSTAAFNRWHERHPDQVFFDEHAHRQEDGALLWPERFGPDEVATAKRELQNDYAGQYQQRPAPRTGNLFKASWMRFWYPAGQTPPQHWTYKDGDGNVRQAPQREAPLFYEEVIQSWDLAFKDAAGSSRVAGGVWARQGTSKYLLDQTLRRMDIVESMNAIRSMSARWPQADVKLVEDKANGPAVIRMLRDEVPGLIAVNPEGGKVARANAVAFEFEAGHVYLPHPALHPWVADFLDELLNFPGALSDQVDQTTQALRRLRVEGSTVGIRSYSFRRPLPKN